MDHPLKHTGKLKQSKIGAFFNPLGKKPAEIVSDSQIGCKSNDSHENKQTHTLTDLKNIACYHVNKAGLTQQIKEMQGSSCSVQGDCQETYPGTKGPDIRREQEKKSKVKA